MKRLLLIGALVSTAVCTTFAQNHFYVLNKTGLKPRSVSSDNKFIVGQTLQHAEGGFMWEIGSGQDITLLNETNYPKARNGEAFQMNGKHQVGGTFPDPNYKVNGIPTPSGGVWENGKWESVGIGFLQPDKISTANGSVITSISEDGSTVAGHSFKTSEKGIGECFPTSWTKKDGKWEPTIWAYPVNTNKRGSQWGAITGMSADGKCACGWTNYDGSVPRRAIVWKSSAEYKVIDHALDLPAEFTRMSANGRYAAGRISSEKTAIVYDLSEDKMYELDGDGAISASNNGIVTGSYFIWSKDLGTIALSDYIRTYCPDLDAEDYDIQTIRAIMNISNDGKILTGWSGVDPGGRDSKTWTLTQTELPKFINRPLDPTYTLENRNKVTFTWKAPTKYEGNTLTQYIIFRNDAEIARVSANELKYVDESAPNGEQVYRVKAVYGNKISQASDKTKVEVMAPYDFPFTEDFEVGLTSGCWKLEGGRWNTAFKDAGIAGSKAVVYTSLDNSFTYNTFLQTRPIDGKNAKNIYLTFAYGSNVNPVKFEPNKMYLEYAETANPVEWKTIKEYTFEKPTDYNLETIDLSKTLAGKIFNVRFRVTGNGKDAVRVYIDEVSIADKMPEGNAPKSVAAQEQRDKTINVTWQDPQGYYEWVCAPKQHESLVGIGNESKAFIVVNKMDPAELAPYKGMELKSITAFVNQYNFSKDRTATKLKLAVFEGDKRVVDQEIEHVDGEWNIFKLNQPVTITGNETIRYGLEIVEHYIKERPIGVYPLPVAPGKGDLYSEDGGKTWLSLLDIDQKVTWNIAGNITTKENTEEKKNDVFGYELYRNGARVNNGLLYSQTCTDLIPEKRNCYTVRAYSTENGISAMSEEVCVGETSIKNIEQGISIYPNPATDFVCVEGEFTKVALYDINGLAVAKTSTNTLSVKQLQKGTYILLVETNEGRMSQKILINR